MWATNTICTGTGTGMRACEESDSSADVTICAKDEHNADLYLEPRSISGTCQCTWESAGTGFEGHLHAGGGIVLYHRHDPLFGV